MGYLGKRINKMDYNFAENFDYCKETVAELITRVDADDREWLAKHDHWESFTDAFIEDVKTKHCFLDVGAGLGFYSLIAKKYNPDIEVIAVEADPARAAALRYFLNVTVYDVALGADTGITKVNKVQICSSSIVGKDNGYPVIELPLWVIPQVDIMKIDIEGAELNLLKGANEFFKNAHPRLYLEIHNSQRIPLIGGNIKDLEELLKQYGYELHFKESRVIL